MRLDMVEELVGRVPVLRLLGSLDITTVDALRERQIGLLERDTPAVALDLAQVTLVDSSGMGVLLGGKKRAVEREVGFFLLDCPAPLQRLVVLVGMDSVLDYCSGRQLHLPFPR